MSDISNQPFAQLIRVGFWTKRPEEPKEDGLLWPGDLVDPGWDRQLALKVVDYLASQPVILRYRGSSWCRLCPDRLSLGSAEHSDGTYRWPQGFGHYVLLHGVKPPEPFLSHVLSHSGNNKPSINSIIRTMEDAQKGQ